MLQDQVSRYCVNVIYTIGTSMRPVQEFIGLLRQHGMSCVVDVRRFPTSKFEHFKKGNLQKHLEASAIRYSYMGKELGGFRSGGYEKFMRGADFADALRSLEEIATERPTAVMCCERFPWKCHRRFIAGALEDRGWRVIHIIDDKKVWEKRYRAGRIDSKQEEHGTEAGRG